MENLNGPNLLFAFLGILFFALLRLKALHIKGEAFSPGFWLKKNYLEVLAALIIAFVGIISQSDLVGFVGLQIINNENINTDFRSFLIGTMSYPLVTYFSSWAEDYKAQRR